MKRLFLFFCGVRRMRIGRSYAGELMNLCRQGGFVYRNLRFCGEQVCFEATLLTSRRILSACADRGISVVVDREWGLPLLFHRYRSRYGLAVGLLCFAAIVFFSGRVLWSIQPEGNRMLSDAQVLEELAACGLRVGMPLSQLDTEVLENRVLIASDEISWISINMRGTVAHVELREVESVPPTERYDAANLVAEQSGIIERFENIRGNLAVKIGDVVSRGDLLVGGLYDIEGGGYRYRCAEGQVFAKTEREFEVEIPLSFEKKCYTGRVRCEKTLIFFEKEVKFFGNSGNLYGTCDKIETVEYLELSGDRRLPIAIRTVRYLEYEIREAQRGEAAARELAYEQLRMKIESSVPEGQLLYKHVTSKLTDSSFYLRCRAEYLEDIATVQEIEIEGIS